MSATYDCECDNFEMLEDQDVFTMNEGIPGPGVPAGGSAGQILQKRSQEDYDTEWVTPDGYVPAGGSAGQILKKSSAEDYDTEWDSLDAGDVSFDSSLTYAAGSVGKEICDVKNTLNHKADVIYDTASGDIASFPDGADGLPVKDLTVSIEPVQSGTGDPSPTNVRPITGWTGANVRKTGKNLIDQSLTYQDGNNTTTFGQSVNNTDPQIFLKAGTYTLHVVTNKACSIYYRKGAGGGNTHLIHAGTDLVGTFTLDSDTYCAFWCYISNGFTASNIISVQLEQGSTASTYQAYSGTTIPISWQSQAGTVYGGTLDVTSGVLTVDRAMVTIDDTYTPSKNGGILCFYNTSSIFPGLLYPSDNNTKVDFYCNIYEVATANTVKNKDCRISVQGSSNHRTDINDTMYNDDVNGWKAARAVTPLVVVYKLATPLVIQLDPVTVNTLLGQNNIWSDTGSSTVEYPTDTKLYIDKKLAALVAALS